MKRLLFLLSFCFFFVLMGTTTSSCSRKTGCPVNENAHVKPNRKGQLPTKRGKSTLFPKEMKKRKKNRR